jgi:hypothetical protein
MRRFLLPLAIFIVLVGFLAVGLRLNPREVPSPLIGKPVPSFRLPQLQAPDSPSAPKICAARSGCSTSGPRGVSPAARSTRS